jgi:hypothetical protein
MERAVDALDELILTEKLDCRRIRPGFLRVATTPAYQFASCRKKWSL